MTVDFDSLRMAGTVLLLARSLDALVRQRGADGLGLAEISVLRQVDRGINLPSQVARALRLDPGRVTRLVDRLVELGYIDRTIDTEDRRRSRLCLTLEGTARLEVGRKVISEVTNSFLQALNDEQRQNLAQGLEAVRTVLDTDTARHAEQA